MHSQPIMEGETGAVLGKLLRLEVKCEVLQATVDDLSRVAEATKKDVSQLTASRFDFSSMSGAQRGNGHGGLGPARSLFQKSAPGVFSAHNTESEDTSAASDDDMILVASKKK